MTEGVFLTFILPLVFLLCGIGLLIGGVVSAARTRAFLAKAAVTTGEVIALEEEPAMEPGDSRTYRPVVSFALDSMERIQFKSIAHSNPPEHEVGESVTVLYDPKRPQEARIRSFTSLWLLAVILVGLGLIFSVLGAALLFNAVPL